MTVPTVKVKPLEWGKDDCAEIMGLRYLLCDPSTADETNGWYVLEETTNTLIEADGSPEAAKAAAQADYEARILSAIDTTDLEAHLGAVLAEAAQACEDESDDDMDEWDRGRNAGYLGAARVILALRKDALTALDRAKREARLEGMQAALEVVAKLPYRAEEIMEGHEEAYRAIEDLIAAEKRIAQAPPGQTLIDTHGLPDDEGDDWDIRVGKPREAEERGEGRP